MRNVLTSLQEIKATFWSNCDQNIVKIELFTINKLIIIIYNNSINTRKQQNTQLSNLQSIAISPK